MQDTAGGGREIDSNFSKSPQSKKASFPLHNQFLVTHRETAASKECWAQAQTPEHHSGLWGSQIGRRRTGMATRHNSKCPQQSHIYKQLGDASNPGSGIGKDFKWTKHLILMSTALTWLQLAEEREIKDICSIYSRETSCEPSVLSHHHSHQMWSFL